MVETDIGRLHVESAGSGPAIVIWPGLLLGGYMLRAQFDACARDHRVLLIDPPGHGDSDPPRRRFSLDDCAQAMLKVLDDAGIARAVLLGASWGGPVCVAAALRAPERVRGLILMNAPMHALTRWELARFWLLNLLYRWLGPRAFLLRSVMSFQLSREFRAAHPERVAAINDSVHATDRAGMVLAIRFAPSSLISLLPRADELRAPTLFITGASDTVIPLAVARREASAVRGSRLEVVEGSAHQCGYEAPEQVNASIGEFLRGLPAAS